ncbi:MAG: hypothetical protein K2H64_00600 [Desulfovibrio sp.]|nr:hypothetical protein [Desulfovibrio sp.]
MDNDNKRDSAKTVEVEVLPPEDNASRASRQEGRHKYAAGPVFAYSSFDSRGCLSPTVTLVLFFILLIQFGLLAAIGFGVFYTCGAILGSLRMTRAMIMGRPVNPMLWRTANWCLSFLLTVWLAGGFND